MVSIKCFQVGYLQTNCYVITEDNSNNAVLIDTGGGFGKITDYLESTGKIAVAVLFTHGHFDHITDAYKWQKCGAELYIHALDAEMLEGKHNLAEEMGLTLPYVKADVIVNDGDVLNFGFIKFKVIHTPGHTKGGVCYELDDKYLFSGDTVFYHSYGRTDFYGGDFNELENSVKKILNTDIDKIIYPGHGESTTIKEEKHFNPLL